MLGVDLQVLLKTERDLAARRLIDHHKQQHATVPAPVIIAIIIIIMMINPLHTETHCSEQEADTVRAEFLGQDLPSMLLESLPDMEEELAEKVTALHGSYETLHRLRNSSMICSCSAGQASASCHSSRCHLTLRLIPVYAFLSLVLHSLAPCEETGSSEQVQRVVAVQLLESTP